MSLAMSTFTMIHVALSLIGILSGFVVALGMLAAKRLDGITALFLATSVATSATGFFFPFHGCDAGYRDWRYLDAVAGDRDSRAIRVPSRRPVAMDLRGDGPDGPVSECVCLDRAAL